MTITAAEGSLDRLAELGVFATVDVHVARTLGRLGGETGDEVLLAAALAARAPRHGHVCVELDLVADRVAAQDPETEEPVHLRWPDPDGWIAALRASPLTRGREDGIATPLVLDGQRLYLDRYWRYQCRLRDRLLELAGRERRDVDEQAVGRELERLFPDHGEDDIDRQRLAAALAVGRDLTVISGGPGTGKTSTIVRILALLLTVGDGGAARPDRGDERGGRDGGAGLQGRDGGPRVALAAPTGKAAARMQQAIREAVPHLAVDDEVKRTLADRDASTLHRLLGWRSDNSTRFRHDADEPLAYDVVVVDEASMVSLALMTKLVDAMPAGGRLILVGDREQLASVEAGAVLGDICGPLRSAGGSTLRLSAQVADEIARRAAIDVRSEAEIVPAEGIWDGLVQLERFHRFGPETGIGAVARGIQRIDRSADQVVSYLRGEAREDGRPGGYDDVRVVAPGGEALPRAVRDAIVRGYRPYVEAALRGDDPGAVLEALDRQRVLAGLRRGPQGVETLNPLIEGWLSREVDGFEPRGSWYVGRPIIVTRNDYGVGLYNGDVGVVVDHPDESGTRTVAFPSPDGSVRCVGPARLPAHETVFAMTVHKAQGSQFDRVHLVLPTVDVPLLTRELVYTGVTRAVSEVTVVADEAVLRSALLRPVQRASGLTDELWAEAPVAPPV